MKICLCFGGPSDERNISAGSIKPWVTWLEAEPGVELAVLFFDRAGGATPLPEVYYYANTCEDFESQLDPGVRLTGAALRDFFSAQDVVVPLIHGRFGEDGELQRLLEEAGVAYVFSDPAALELTMDKARCYERLASEGLPVPEHWTFDRAAWRADPRGLYERALALATFGAGPERPALAVKPNRGGSSIGVSILPAAFESFRRGVESALRQDDLVLVESLLEGREFSVVVLELNGQAVPLAPTEVEPRAALYDTRAKYLHGAGARLHTPMRDEVAIEPVRRAALRAWHCTGLRDMARIDGFLSPEGLVTITDINGISGMGFSSFGFLQTSMAGLRHGGLIKGLLTRAASRAGLVLPRLSLGASARSRVHVLFGGHTSERQVSRQSGIFAGLCLMARGYDVHFVFMDAGCRFTEVGLFYALHHDVAEIQALIASPEDRARVERAAERIGGELGSDPSLVDAHLFVGERQDLAAAVERADFVFLALHGGPGEDGTLQAALESLAKPYNGCGPAASRLCADKIAANAHVAARGLDGVGLPRQRRVARPEFSEWLRHGSWRRVFEELRTELGSRLVICKPASDGCSTGVKLLADEHELEAFVRAIVEMRPFLPAGALGPDSRPLMMPEPPPIDWLFEEALVDLDPVPLPEGDWNLHNLRGWLTGRRFVELTCAIIEIPGRGLCAATPSLTVARASELSLEEKFQQGVGTNLEIKSFLSPVLVRTIRERAARIAEAIGVTGYARLDCFYDQHEDRLYLLEVNTLCALTEATVFYSQALNSFGAPPGSALEWIVQAGLGSRPALARLRRPLEESLLGPL